MNTELPFATQEGESSAPQNSRETLLNMFVEIETSGRRKIIRRQRAGLDQVYAITGEKRCIEKYGDFHFVVIDATFYKFDGASLTSIGTLGTATGRCTLVFDDVGNGLLSPGDQDYYYSYNATAGTITKRTPGTAVGPATVLAGYGAYSVPGTHQFYITALNDFTTVDPLDFASAESNPDTLVRAFADHNELWLFGKVSTEIWGLSGGTDFPFAPLTNATMQRGCAAALSVAAEDNSVFWLGNDLIVYRGDGFRPVRISTHAIERLIADVPVAVAARGEAFFYTQEGHKFYTLRFPGYLTVQYNVATGLWNGAGTYTYDDWKVVGTANGLSDYVLTDAGICTIDPSLNTDEDGILQRRAIAAPIWAGGNRVVVRSFFIDVEVGRAAVDVTDPQVVLRVAPDGETFGNERSRSLGSIGEYNTRVMWRQLGIGRKMTLEVTCTDDVSFKMIGADTDVFVTSS